MFLEPNSEIANNCPCQIRPSSTYNIHSWLLCFCAWTEGLHRCFKYFSEVINIFLNGNGFQFCKHISESGKKYSVIISQSLGKIKCLGTGWRGSYSAGCSICSLLFSYQTLTGPHKGLYPKICSYVHERSRIWQRWIAHPQQIGLFQAACSNAP